MTVLSMPDGQPGSVHHPGTEPQIDVQPHAHAETGRFTRLSPKQGGSGDMGPGGPADVQLAPEVQQQKLQAFVLAGSPLVRSPTELEMDAILRGTSATDEPDMSDSIPNHEAGQTMSNDPDRLVPEDGPPSKSTAAKAGSGETSGGSLQAMQSSNGMQSARPESASPSRRRLTVSKPQKQNASSDSSKSIAAPAEHEQMIHKDLLPSAVERADASSSDDESADDAASSDADSDASSEYVEHDLAGTIAWGDDATTHKPARQASRSRHPPVDPASLLTEVSLRQRHTASRRPSDDIAVAAASAQFLHAASSHGSAASPRAQPASPTIPAASPNQQSLQSAMSAWSSAWDTTLHKDEALPATAASHNPTSQSPPAKAGGRSKVRWGSSPAEGSSTAESSGNQSPEPSSAAAVHSQALSTNDAEGMQQESSFGGSKEQDSCCEVTSIPTAATDGLISAAETDDSTHAAGQGGNGVSAVGSDHRSHAARRGGRLLSPQVSLLGPSAAGVLNQESGMRSADPVEEGADPGAETPASATPSVGLIPSSADTVDSDDEAPSRDQTQNDGFRESQNHVHGLAGTVEQSAAGGSDLEVSADNHSIDAREPFDAQQERSSHANGIAMHEQAAASHVGHQEGLHMRPGHSAPTMEVESMHFDGASHSADASRRLDQPVQGPADVPEGASEAQQEVPSPGSPAILPGNHLQGIDNGQPAAAHPQDSGSLSAFPAAMPAAGDQGSDAWSSPGQTIQGIAALNPGASLLQGSMKPPLSPSRLRNQTGVSDDQEFAASPRMPASPYGLDGGLAKPQDLGRVESAEPALLLERGAESDEDDQGLDNATTAIMHGEAVPAALHAPALSSIRPAVPQYVDRSQPAPGVGTVSSHPIGESLREASSCMLCYEFSRICKTAGCRDRDRL